MGGIFGLIPFTVIFEVIPCTCIFCRKYDFQKTQLLLQITTEIYPNSWITFSVVLTKLRFGYLKLETWNFMDFVFTFVNMGPKASENFKTLLLLQIAAKNFQTCPEFSFQWSSPNDVFKFGLSDFCWFIFKSFQFTIVPHGETKNLIYLESEGSHSKMGSNLGLANSISTYMVYHWPCSIQGHFGDHPVYFRVFFNLALMIRDGKKAFEWL